ncbi:MAG: DSD1 family PLP-dependent enzyme [Dehalococcoidia bacterium]|nr:DSD1 family PLP-dependent enzyme [Dehalococcoidia bacterium]
MHRLDVDTPALLLDLDAVESNIATMAAFFAGQSANLRPHFKTPKTPEVARRQLEAGAIGITVAKLGEAEVLADAGLGPILMANQVVGSKKIDRLMALLARGVDITVAVESQFNIDELAAGMQRSGQVASAIVEVDSGMHRCGTGEPGETIGLARALQDAGIRYRGIMGYEGHAVLIADPTEREEKARAALGIVHDHGEALAEAGLPPEIVSVGGTGSHAIAGAYPGVTEVQAGSYVFMDGRYQEVLPGAFRSALTLVTTVLSVRERYAVCDMGMKSLTNEFGAPMSVDGSIKVARLSEEHAHLSGDGIASLKPGDKVEVLPSHGDTTLNLHDVYHVTRGDEIIDEWPILAARKYR